MVSERSRGSIETTRETAAILVRGYATKTRRQPTPPHRTTTQTHKRPKETTGDKNPGLRKSLARATLHFDQDYRFKTVVSFFDHRIGVCRLWPCCVSSPLPCRRIVLPSCPVKRTRSAVKRTHADSYKLNNNTASTAAQFTPTTHKIPSVRSFVRRQQRRQKPTNDNESRRTTNDE
mgnify:CR=1 FL=1